MNSRDRHPRRRTLVLLSIGLVGLSLGIHLLYLSQIEDNIFFTEPKLDSKNYHETALRILGGEEIAEGVLTGNPLYPLVLSVLYRFMEEPDFHTVRVVQSVVGALICALIMLLGVRFFDLRTGILAGVASLFYAPFLFFDGELIQSPWVLLALLLAFAILPYSPERKGAGRLLLIFLAGVFLGVGTLGRPNMLPFLVFF